MKNIKFIVICTAICAKLLFGTVTTESAGILTKVMDRMKGVDQSYQIEMIQMQKGKPDQIRMFRSLIHWPDKKDIQKQIFLEYLAPKDMLGVKYWEFRMEDNSVKKWRTMPVTGKLKDISNISEKKMRGNAFRFSDIEITREMIETNELTVIGKDNLLGMDVVIIDSITSKPGNGEPYRKRIWVDPVHSIILKAVFFNRKERPLTVIECTELGMYENKYIYKQISVENKKKKLNIYITLSEYSNDPIKDLDIFNPVGK